MSLPRKTSNTKPMSSTEESSSSTPPSENGNGGFVSLDIINSLFEKQQNSIIQLIEATFEKRLDAVEQKLELWAPKLDEKFEAVDRHLEYNDNASQASLEELHNIKESLMRDSSTNLKIEAITAENTEELRKLRMEQQIIEEKIAKLNNVSNKFRSSLSSLSPVSSTVTQRSPGGDVVMRDASSHYEYKIPDFDGNNIDIDSFCERCLQFFRVYSNEFNGDESTKVYIIEDHLKGDAQRWYFMEEKIRQRADPNSIRLLENLRTEFPSMFSEDYCRTSLLKLRHEWGKAYEFMAEFNRLTRVLKLDDPTKKVLLMQEVKPSVREAMYDIDDKNSQYHEYVDVLMKCDKHPELYKRESIDKYDSRRERKIIIMALLGIIDPLRPSQQIENFKKTRSNSSKIEGKSKVDYSNKGKDIDSKSTLKNKDSHHFSCKDSANSFNNNEV